MYVSSSLDEDPGALPQFGRHLPGAERDASGKGPGFRIGCRRQLADMPVEALARLRPEFDRNILANLEALKRPNACSGKLISTSRSPSAASVNTVWPAATTWPTSI